MNATDKVNAMNAEWSAKVAARKAKHGVSDKMFDDVRGRKARLEVLKGFALRNQNDAEINKVWYVLELLADDVDKAHFDAVTQFNAEVNN